MSDSLKAIKAEHIKASLANPQVDVDQLRHYCRTPYGLVNSKLRSIVWPILVGLTPDYYPEWTNLKNASSVKLINQDVNRSFVSLDIVENDSALSKAIKRKQLYHILNGVLGADDTLHYYQGFNEIASIFFLVAGENLGFKISMKVAQNYVRDCMRSSFDIGFVGAMKSIYVLVNFRCPELHEVLVGAMPEMPSPCVGWILAWFSQKLNSFEGICRIFDFLLANHALTPIYLTAIILLELKVSIFALVQDEGTIHSFLNKVLLHIDWDFMIEKTSQLLEEFPPEQLIAETPFTFLPDSPYLFPSASAHLFVRQPRTSQKDDSNAGKLILAGAAAAVVGFMGFKIISKMSR